MKLTIRKTDKRFTGYQKFNFVVDVKIPYVPTINGNASSRMIKLKKFQEIRDWCISVWGMSCEREHWLTIEEIDNTGLNAHWCWHSEFYDAKIYLATEKEANWFKLRWA